MTARTPFTVGIPVFNEEAILVPNTERLLYFLDGLGREYEVIIGSNGSTDSTTALGVDLSRRFASRVTFFHLPQPGVGLAFREFLARAKHPLLVSADMDLSVDLSFIREALELLETHDIVVGSKKLGQQKRSFLRKLGSDTFLRIARLLLGMAYEDYSIAAKAYRVETVRRFADRINAGSSYVIEMCFLTHRSGGKVIQIPVSCEDWRASKFNLVHEALYKYSHLIRLWLRNGRARPQAAAQAREADANRTGISRNPARK
jgi:glycosyltransferase involved in cell wall biosynthesis